MLVSCLRAQARRLTIPKKEVGKAGLDWTNLGFDFRPSNGFMKYTWKEGKWDEGSFETEPYFKMHIMSSAIHYGQGLFEGTKAHHCADGTARLWNVSGNADRMNQGAKRMLIPEVPKEMFLEACDRVVAMNLDYLPPYGTGGSLYLRPVLFGMGPQLGLQPAPEYVFAVLAIPVSSYYKGGLSPVKVLVVEDHDRSAPKGVGNVKVSGNYGADILPSIAARAKGYPTVLYLDAHEKKYIEEFSVSNFVGIQLLPDGRKKYVTPKSPSILVSCTNQMLMKLAPSMGYDVEWRPVKVSELSTFNECAGCGTAVVLMGVDSITHGQTVHQYGGIKNIESLYSLYRSIQFGETEDVFGWGQKVSAHDATNVNFTATPLPEAVARIRKDTLGETVPVVKAKPAEVVPDSSTEQASKSKPKVAGRRMKARVVYKGREKVVNVRTQRGPNGR
eukprot:gene20875-32200_t